MTLVDPDRQQETIKKESNKKVWGMGFVTPETFAPIFRLDPELKSGLARRSGSAQPTPALGRPRRAFEADIAARKVRMSGIAEDQQRIPENLKALKGSSEEQALVER
jgi:hypothetical protein